MYTLENPCESEEDMNKFTRWWQWFTHKDVEQVLLELRMLRIEVANLEERISMGMARKFLLTPAERSDIGRLQEQIIPLRGKLLQKERSSPFAQPSMILAVPRVKGFWLSNGDLWFETHCLYGRDDRTSTSPWCKIGRMRVRVIPQTMYNVYRPNAYWENLDGDHMVVTGSRVPAPQVDPGGLRACMGTVAHDYLVGGQTSGRIDVIVAAIIRYTECPHISLEKGMGMGRFPPVPDAEVPEFYLKAFPR